MTSLDDVARALGLAASHPGVELRGMTLDSRRVQPGDLYAALPGSRAHGATFSEQAAASGAVALLTDAEGADLA
ncbi:Mur ligase domain-containing protein, partial [Nocardioides kongjuensis]|uniref:Mur ligase domain-containing protein n=1 Tax=Nocardioides kongjuensis TaxID=349522 RepID=UPI0035E8C401